MTAPTLRLEVVEKADIRGEKTRIRPMGPDEARMVAEWTQDPDVQPFWGGREHYRDLDDFLSHWEAHYMDGSRPAHGRNFIVEDLPAKARGLAAQGRGDGRPIGMINYNSVDTSNRSTEIDIVIGAPGYRDRGYGTDALCAFLAFLFDTIGLHRVWLATYDYNERARHVYEKIGFVREGVTRQSDWVDGRWVDSVIYGILEHELRRP